MAGIPAWALRGIARRNDWQGLAGVFASIRERAADGERFGRTIRELLVIPAS